jgi:hypothetical protein
MLKTISTALLAVSVLAAPALAATSGKTGTHAASVTKQAPMKTSSKTGAKAGLLNANAKMGSHQARHHKHYRHLSQHKPGTLKTHTKVSATQAKPVSKRG